MTVLSKSRYTATRGVPDSFTVQSYHLTPRLRADRESRQTRPTHSNVTAHPGFSEIQQTVQHGLSIRRGGVDLGNTLAELNPGDSVDTAGVFDVPEGHRCGVDRTERRADFGRCDGRSVGVRRPAVWRVKPRECTLFKAHATAARVWPP